MIITIAANFAGSGIRLNIIESFFALMETYVSFVAF